ncbi:unnamed protein product [Cyclocybe aegerita]|uniref:Uncharacterized protein n=1 Tax=Cyclocybe aegerita TaxID=1973307 RepID=A0A8S0WHU6_CYCAE|nr:unnamed protein product [Cyclocybe aegerita]
MSGITFFVTCEAPKTRGCLLVSPSVKIGIDPCGWCGQDPDVAGCKTSLIRTEKDSLSVESNCLYFYSKMRYSDAANFSESSPCNNVPLHCPLCPREMNGQHTTFWKYNFTHHITTYHLTDSGQFPPFPREFRINTHISMDEEQQIGIHRVATEKYRTDNAIPNSDGLMEPENYGHEDSDSEADEAQRKRAASCVSQSSVEPVQKPIPIQKPTFTCTCTIAFTSSHQWRCYLVERSHVDVMYLPFLVRDPVTSGGTCRGRLVSRIFLPNTA